MRVTTKQLGRMGACPFDVEIVESEWPRGVPITTPSLRKAFRLGLGVEWFAARVLESPAWMIYWNKRQSAWADGRNDRATFDAARAAALVPLLRAALR